MRTAFGIRRLRVERRLFEIHADLALAREEVAELASRHARLLERAEAARVRMVVAETARAHEAWQEARRELAALGATLKAARSLVAELERAQSEAFDELLAPNA
jgi:hypothetical protein